MCNTKLDSISPLISTPICAPAGESADMHYGQMESGDFMLCNTFNRQLLGDGLRCNVFLAGAQESRVGGSLIASLLPHLNQPGRSVRKRWSGCMSVHACKAVCVQQQGKFHLELPLWHCLCVCVCEACVFRRLCMAEFWIQAAPISLGLHPQTFSAYFSCAIG